MPSTSEIEVSKLSIDLKNFRTVPQKKEADAIKAMIAIKPDRFYAIMDSIIDDGYLPTENIIVLKESASKLIVKEGNRRIAALKLIHGFHKLKEFNLPFSIVDKIRNIDATWKSGNLKVPCTVFPAKEEDMADRVVTLAHGKGEKASRDPWSSVARARHNRDVKKGSELALDLLEKYLKHGQNLNNQQKDRWAGDYPLTVLDDAIRKTHSRLGFPNSADLVKKYPKIAMLSEFEEVMRDIGLQLIGFEKIRSTQEDIFATYGIPVPAPAAPTTPSPAVPTTPTTPSPSSGAAAQPAQQSHGQQPTTSSGTTTPTPATPAPTTPRKAYANNDPKHVATLLKTFNPRGSNRQKVVTLRDEIKRLKIKDHPFAFCFLLRSMFEISAKAYCADNSISTTSSNGKEKPLVDLLRDITNHLTRNSSNPGMLRTLHGAIAEIARQEGILSVRSMNQLVHNPSFSIQPNDICLLFGNVYPLLEAMN